MSDAGIMTALPRSQGKEAIRRQNLSAMLSVILRSGACSRSDLIMRLRLSRTTVAALSGQLADRGLVHERAPETTSGVGRPSTMVHPSAGIVAFAVNPEFDAVSVGAVALDGSILGVRRVEGTPFRNPEAVAMIAASAIDDLWRELPSGSKVAGCGVAVPGQVVQSTGTVLRAHSIGWGEVDFAKLLADRIGVTVQLGNNARLVMRAEQRIGAAKDIGDVVSVFAGAGGIGGGVVSDDRTITGAGGFAGEIGQVRVSFPGDTPGSIVRGTFSALVRRDDLVRALGVGPVSDAQLHELVITSDTPDFLAVARLHVQALCEVIANLANLLNPSAIVLGGFLGSLYRRFTDEVEAAIADTVIGAIASSLQIRVASDTTGMVLTGAAQLVWDRLIEEPLATPLRGRSDAWNGARS